MWTLSLFSNLPCFHDYHRVRALSDIVILLPRPHTHAILVVSYIHHGKSICVCVKPFSITTVCVCVCACVDQPDDRTLRKITCEPIAIHLRKSPRHQN